MIPNKLQKGDHVRVVACSNSLAIISEPVRALATERFQQLGLTVSFAQHCELIDEFNSSSIAHRVDDLHQAFADPNVNAIFSVIGGNNANQLLKYLDYDLIKNNPKIICGYSDTTALLNAIYRKTGLVTYCGPAYSTLGMLQGLEYTLEYLEKCLFSTQPYTLTSPLSWSDDKWFLQQQPRHFIPDQGLKVANSGTASGVIIGGNLCTLNLLQGTEFMPELNQAIVFIEDDELSFAENFDRDLQSLLHQANFDRVKALVIGRFQNASAISEAKLKRILATKQELAHIPILYNASFGHTTPQACFPIGGLATIDTGAEVKIRIDQH